MDSKYLVFYQVKQCKCSVEFIVGCLKVELEKVE